MIEDFESWNKKDFQKLVEKYKDYTKEKQKDKKSFSELRGDLKKDGLTKNILIEIGKWKTDGDRLKHHLEKNDDEDKLRNIYKDIKKIHKNGQNNPFETFKALLNTLKSRKVNGVKEGIIFRPRILRD